VLRQTVVVWNVGVDVVADEQLDDVVVAHLARVAESRASGIVARVDVSSSRQQQLDRQHPSLFLLDASTSPCHRSYDLMRTNCEPTKCQPFTFGL